MVRINKLERLAAVMILISLQFPSAKSFGFEFNGHFTGSDKLLAQSFTGNTAYPVAEQYQLSNGDQKSVFGMTIGGGYGKLRSNDLNDPEFNFKPSFTKYAGFTLDVPIPALEKRGYFFSELSFSQYAANSFVNLPDTTLGHPERDYYEITQKFAPNTLTLVNTFRYCFVNRDFKYYVSAGISNSFLISPENKKTTVNFRNGETKSETESVIPDYAVHGLMLIVGTGITYKYIGLELRYDPGRNYTKKVDYSIHQPSLSAHLHIRFNP